MLPALTDTRDALAACAEPSVQPERTAVADSTATEAIARPTGSVTLFIFVRIVVVPVTLRSIFAIDARIAAGQLLYERGIATGGSVEIFHDTVVPSLADRSQHAHPDLEPLGPDQDPNEDADVTATADVTVLGVHGPYLSVEYQVDTTGNSNDV